MSELVTGEAVVLGLRSARLPSRALARLLDGIIYMVGYFFAFIFLSLALSQLESAAVMAFSIGLMAFFLLVLPVLVETLSQGRSVGKAALGLRVVRTDGGPIRFRHALVRGLIGVIEFGLSAMPAVLSSLFSSDGRRLGDVFGGTLVIRERLPQSARDQGMVPPVQAQVMHALGTELAALDLSAVPDGLWLSSRQLVGRMRELDAPVAAGLAERLAADLSQRVAWPVPDGLPPLVYLGAVLMERQRRAWERAAAANGGAHPAPWGAAPYGVAPFGAAPWGAAPPAQPFTAPGQVPVQAPVQVPGQAVPPAQPFAPPAPAGAAPARVLGYPTVPAQPAPVAPSVPVAPSAPVVDGPAESAPAAGGFAPPA
ncbi:RDD family protein [Kitasatospora sp. NPDC088391]|uniref:RDD family protein n=1 Tax=Kitasatospora sp. NPDC088391 TaxID=3364074 RepID=UPI0037FFC01F